MSKKLPGFVRLSTYFETILAVLKKQLSQQDATSFGCMYICLFLLHEC